MQVNTTLNLYQDLCLLENVVLRYYKESTSDIVYISYPYQSM